MLDRFHITSHLNQAVDQVRRAESTRLRSQSKSAAQRLKHLRWPLLRRGSRVRGRAREKLNALPASRLATARRTSVFTRSRQPVSPLQRAPRASILLLLARNIRES